MLNILVSLSSWTGGSREIYEKCKDWPRYKWLLLLRWATLTTWNFLIHSQVLSKHTISGLYRPNSETPFKWHFAVGPILARKTDMTEKKLVTGKYNALTQTYKYTLFSLYVASRFFFQLWNICNLSGSVSCLVLNLSSVKSCFISRENLQTR